MVIHTKEKPRLHVRGAPETRIKGGNIHLAGNRLNAGGAMSEAGAAQDGRIKIKRDSLHVADRKSAGKIRADVCAMEFRDGNGTAQKGNMVATARVGTTRGGMVNRDARSGSIWGRYGEGAIRNGTVQSKTTQGKTEDKAVRSQPAMGRNSGQGLNREGRMRDKYRETKAAKEKADKNKSSMPVAVASAAAKTALYEMDGGREVYDAYAAAGILVKPAVSAASLGMDLYRSRAAGEKRQRLKKKPPGSRIGKRPGNGSVGAGKAARESPNPSAPKGNAGRGAKVSGQEAGKAAGNRQDRAGLGAFAAVRMAQLFAAKLRREDGGDSAGKALKDIAKAYFLMLAKRIAGYLGLFFCALFAVVALVALPVIAVIAIIYNSPFAVFFPSISSGETVQEVLSAYVTEFNNEVDAELKEYDGYDKSEKIYEGFEGSGTPDIYCDILMVYMVKYGDGDTATDMTDQAKRNLKGVFDDMCGYAVSGRTDTDTDDEGNAVTEKVKEVKVELKSCYDMVSVYRFNEDERAVLDALMKPEYLALLGCTGGGGGPGEALSPERYQAVVDSVTDENGRQTVAFALSKVGSPYSQAYRDSGRYYDCSSLAYYAWRAAGVNLMYEGSNTAASEGKFCYDHGLLVDYGEMRPGDLIFYSYEKNGSFMDISHVAIYAGDGMAVEAANTRLGVVYRPVQGRSSIVFIGRPR